MKRGLFFQVKKNYFTSTNTKFLREGLFIKRNKDRWEKVQQGAATDPDEMATNFIQLVDDLAHTAAEKVKTHLNIETGMSPFDFLEVLLKDYNYLSVK